MFFVFPRFRFSAALTNMAKQDLPNDYNLFDLTGTYFWCPERKFDDSVMVSVSTNNVAQCPLGLVSSLG